MASPEHWNLHAAKKFFAGVSATLPTGVETF